MARNIYRNVAYGLSDALTNVFQQPIVSQRDPGANDKYQIGTLWVNTGTNDGFILTSVVANVANWVGIGGGAGTFSSITVNPGDATISAGNLIVTLGDINVGAGDITATAGAISAGTTLSAGTTVTAGTGITATTGNIVATAGNINATVGSVSAASLVSGEMIAATGDNGTGFATITSITNATNTTQGVGVLSILSTNGNPGNNAGFIKVYIGLTEAYIPYYTNIAP